MYIGKYLSKTEKSFIEFSFVPAILNFLFVVHSLWGDEMAVLDLAWDGKISF